MNRFERAFALLKVHEGGYVNHPRDPGGATNKGVTQRTYNSYRRRNGQATKSVKHISDAEVATIYRNQYWNAVRGDDLPAGLAYCVFDAAVNSGPGRAVKWLQEQIGAGVDGVVGNETISMAREAATLDVIDGYCDARLAFMKRLKHWPTFKNGWSRRVREVRAQSKAWVENKPIPDTITPPPAKAQGDERKSATLKDAVKDPAIWLPALPTVGALFTGQGPVQYALAACIVLAVVFAGYQMLRKERTQ